jgi:ABA responsive element binding factor
MASEMSKNVKALDEQEVTSQHSRAQTSDAAEEQRQQQAVDPLARQSSIMSLTLEELQNSLCEPGRNFGSMNMDEFMANIWNAEEFQAATAGCNKEGAYREPVPVATTTGTSENRGGGGGRGLVWQGCSRCRHRYPGRRWRRSGLRSARAQRTSRLARRRNPWGRRGEVWVAH